MAGTGLGAWIRNNIAAILIPIASGVIALVVSYGSSIQEETKLLARIDKLEATVVDLENQDEEFDDDFDDLEDLVSDKNREIENMVISEGRDLERSVIRLESRMDNISRRLALFDGIGAPPPGMLMTPPSFNMEVLDLPGGPLIMEGE